MKPDDYDRQKAALENPRDVSFTKIYAMLGLSVAAAVVVIMIASRG